MHQLISLYLYSCFHCAYKLSKPLFKLKESKVQEKEAENELKKRQRREIYALNSIMTALEHERYQAFIAEHGFRPPIIEKNK